MNKYDDIFTYIYILTSDIMKYLITIIINLVKNLLRFTEKGRLLELHLEIYFHTVLFNSGIVSHFLYVQNSLFKTLYEDT